MRGMAPFLKMNYFEIKNRFQVLEEFRNVYQSYLNYAYKTNDYVAAQQCLDRLQPKTAIITNSLVQIGYARNMMRSEKTVGGKKIKINLIKAIFNKKLQRRYSLNEQIPLKILNLSVARYQTLLWQQQIQLFNPFFWLFHSLEYFLKIPFRAFDSFCFEENIEDLILPRIYLASGQIVLFLYIFKLTGIFDWLKQDLFATFLNIY